MASNTATPTELGYLSGVSSAIQTQLNGKAASGTAVTRTITEASISTDTASFNSWANQAGGNMSAISGLSCTITALASERPRLTFYGTVAMTANPCSIYFGYQVDSGTPVIVGQHLERNSNGTVNKPISFSVLLPALSVGSRVIKIAMSGGSCTLLATDANQFSCKMQVEQVN